jgi:hypothetical protein
MAAVPREREGARMSAAIKPMWMIACTLLLFAAGAQAGTTREWNFTAYLDDNHIGYHVFKLSERDGVHELVSQARFNVKFLFITAYRYAHDNRERWRGDCLARIDSVTDDDGERYRVRGRDTDAGFVIDAGNASATLPDCIMTFAYWNPRFLDQPRLLNAQNGEYLEVSVRDLGADTVTVRGAPTPARRYRLEARDFRIELWYSAEREWLALDSITAGGQRLRYRLDGPRLPAETPR